VLALGDKLPQFGVVGARDPFSPNFGPNNIFRIVKAVHFKFRVLIDTEEY